jgi:hypothetical protein
MCFFLLTTWICALLFVLFEVGLPIFTGISPLSAHWKGKKISFSSAMKKHILRNEEIRDRYLYKGINDCYTILCRLWVLT